MAGLVTQGFNPGKALSKG